jgi:hypothetical protein
MSQLPGQYYEPYDSDTSNVSDGTDGTDDSEYLSDSEDPRIRREEDPRYMILQSKSMNIPRKELSKDNPTSQYAEYDTKTDISSYKDLVYLNPPKTTKSSLFCVRSDSRDHQVFPSPMNFTIKLPRVYKNVTKIQLVQIGFPNNRNEKATSDSAFTSSFVTYLLKNAMAPCCIDRCVITTCTVLDASAIGIVEQGRMNESGTPLMTTISIPDGAYANRNQMGNELTYQANNTPPFNIISYEAFRDIFINTRDISVLFNEPGECFSSKTNNKRYGAHTKENIMNTYYTQQHIDQFPEITEVIAFNAYYYPILKELLATQRAKPFLNTGTLSFDEIMSLVMGTFEGLQSDTYYKIGQLNQNVLDTFRQTLTFELRNINKYQWIHNESANQFITIHDTLHTSLYNDIQKQYQTIYNQELLEYGFHTNSFKALKTNLLQYNCIYKHLETNLSTVLGNYHLVSGYQYRGGDVHSTIESTFQCLSDLQEDSDFTSMFNYQSTIGRIYGNYAGIPMNFTSFQDYHSTLSSYYTTIQSTNQTISSIHGAITNRHHEYVSTKYHNVLPQSMIQNQSYMTNQGLPTRFITNQRFYVPGQNISPQDPTRRSIIRNMIANRAANIAMNTAMNTANSIANSIANNTANSIANNTANVSTMSFQTLQSLQSNSTTSDMNEIVMPSISTNVSIFTMSSITLPFAPTISTIVSRNQQLGVVFTAPTLGDESTINYYQFSVQGPPGPFSTISSGITTFAVNTSTFSTFVINGLNNGQSYPVVIRAGNSAGVGPNSNIVSGTPTTDNCNYECNCFDVTKTCCKYCDLNNDCSCEERCCAGIEAIISSWYSCLPVDTVINTMAYRLGILDTNKPGFNITSTANSILPPFTNNLFMSINDEMGFNNLDVAMPENYAVSNETTGQLKLMFAKIIFSGIGKSGESQTLFQNPLEFETPLGKLDRFTFKVYYDDAALTPVWLSNPFVQIETEWNAIINIEEEISKASRTTGWGPNPTIPIPSNPNATSYLSYTSKDNPNNRK